LSRLLSYCRVDAKLHNTTGNQAWMSGGHDLATGARDKGFVAIVKIASPEPSGAADARG